MLKEINEGIALLKFQMKLVQIFMLLDAIALLILSLKQ